MTPGKSQIYEGELHVIHTLLLEWYSIPFIAQKIGRSKSTLYRLFRNNGIPYALPRFRYLWGKSWKILLRREGKRVVRFQPHVVHHLRVHRRSLASKHYCRICPWSLLEGYILEKLKNAWSPKQISGRWTLETNEKLSKDTIYRHIYSTHRELITKYFRRKWKKYQHDRENKYRIMDRRMIDTRPKHIEERTEIGHWEWDTIVGIRWWSKQVILTNVERKTGYLLAKKLPRASGKCVYEGTKTLFSILPQYKRKTITYDNGKEFCEHRMIERSLSMTVYFAHPYHSWERGTNENTNGLIRQFCPKKTDFGSITDRNLWNYVHLINHRPRERLHFLTPHEVFIEWKSCIWL